MQGGEQVVTTQVNEAEYRVGIYRAPDPVIERAKVEYVLRPLQVLELDARSTDRFARIKGMAYSIGQPIGDCDAFIAAIAMAHNCSLLTRNPKDFVSIAGLVVETY